MMNELSGRSFLRALFHVGQRILRTGTDDASFNDALTALERAAEMLTSGADEVTLTVGDDAFYLGKAMLPHASIEFNGMLRDMQSRNVDSITILPGTDRQDLADLAALVCGTSPDVPAGGTVRLNERPIPAVELERQPISGLRRTYASSLDALRSASGGQALEFDRAVNAVDGLLSGGAAEPGPSLMLATVRNHDETTFYHSVNVCLLALALGRAIGLDGDRLRNLGVGALLHDIGRVLLDDPSLHMHGRLSNEDWAVVRLHPQEGAQAILAATGPGQETAAVVALEHHARIDGGGYPDLGGREPHFYSRVVSVVDAYDAITSHRPYRPARTPNEALSILLDGAGSIFDGDLVRAFIAMMGVYPPGSLLRLDTGEVVMVAAGEEGRRDAFIVRDTAGTPLQDPQPISLDGRTVTAQLLAEEAGVDPASLLEVLGGRPAEG